MAKPKKRRFFFRTFLTGVGADSYVRADSFDFGEGATLKLADCNRSVQIEFTRENVVQKLTKIRTALDKIEAHFGKD